MTGHISPAVEVVHTPDLPSSLGDRDRPLGHVGAAPYGTAEVDQPQTRTDVRIPVDDSHRRIVIEEMLCEPRPPWQTTSLSPARRAPVVALWEAPDESDRAV
jgi:hypothetical protein